MSRMIFTGYVMVFVCKMGEEKFAYWVREVTLWRERTSKNEVRLIKVMYTKPGPSLKLRQVLLSGHGPSLRNSHSSMRVIAWYIPHKTVQTCCILGLLRPNSLWGLAINLWGQCTNAEPKCTIDLAHEMHRGRSR